MSYYDIVYYEAMVEEALGERVDLTTLQGMFKIKNELDRVHGLLVIDYTIHAIDAMEYLRLMNEIMVNQSKQLLALFGDEKFDKIFGEAGRRPEGMIDPEAFSGDSDG